MNALNDRTAAANLKAAHNCTNDGDDYINDDNDNDDDNEDDDDEEEELTTTATDYKTISNADTSMSDYRTLSPDSAMAVNDTKINDYQCRICIKRFKTLQACLRHDLVDHNNERKLPQKAVRLSLKTMLPVLEQNDHQADRPRIHQILASCQRGLELHELLKVYCISDEKARHIGALVTNALKTELSPIRDFSIFKFGSIMNGLMTWDSDVDIYISAGYQHNRGHPNRPPLNKERPLFNRINALLRRGHLFDEIVTIRNARVPIIKCRHPATGMKIDINCSCPSSVVNSQFLNSLLQFDVRLRSLMSYLKIWAKQMKLIGRGNMTSYCLTTLVLFYLQQPVIGKRSVAVVPPIKHLQTSAPAKYVEGINYAYDIHRNMLPLPLDLTIQDFLRGFFAFYRNFDFNTSMVTPFLGKTISLPDLRNGKFHYVDYQRQLRKMREFAGERYVHEDLNIDRCMVVQDPFQLNQNIARGISSSHLEYFRKCIEYAYHICMNVAIKSNAELYERLLFDIQGQFQADARALRASAAGQRMLLDSSQSNELHFTFTPSRIELRALVHYQLNLNTNANTADGVNNNVHREWLHHYVEAIYAILAYVYRMKVRLIKSSTMKKAKKKEELKMVEGDEEQNDVNDDDDDHDDDDEDEDDTHTQLIQSFKQILQEKGELIWRISGSIDLWNGRMYNRQNASSFMEYQIKQTEHLLLERANAEAFAVEVKALLTIKPGDGYKSLALIVTQENMKRAFLTKKDPLRKFFTSFKNSMQNFNLKEKLQAESGRKQIPQSQELKIWKKRNTITTTETMTTMTQ